MLKFRPSLTLPELTHIVALLPVGHPLHKKLSTFIAKCNAGITSPSYIVSAPTTSMDSLGFSPTPQSTTQQSQALWETYKSTPAILSPTQTSAALHYGYTHDLMTPEEESAYEKSTLQ